MSRSRLPVIAAIPAYNEEAVLEPLLQQVLDQEYDEVFVLDDNSHDSTIEIAHNYSKNIKIVAGTENLGPAGNRNRIIPQLGYSAIIHFLDADVSINSTRTPELVRELVAPSDIGYVGGLVRLPDGTQNPWNYGPALSLPQLPSGWLYSGSYNIGKRHPRFGSALRKQLNRWSLVEQWPNPLEQPQARDVYWCSEPNLAISSEIFKVVGGYDPALRYHETMELSMKIANLGLRRRFDPSLDVTHKDNAAWVNQAYARKFYEAQFRIVGKMGMKDFLFPPDSA